MKFDISEILKGETVFCLEKCRGTEACDDGGYCPVEKYVKWLVEERRKELER